VASTSAVDLFVVYQFIKRLATPFSKWKAFQQGVIDKDGAILIPPKERDNRQKESFKIFDVMILKLKKILEKIPFGKSRLASYAAALYLVKEDWENKTEQQILSESNDSYVDYLRLYRLENYGKMLEDSPTNSAGAGQVAGMGVNGPSDVKVPKKKKYKVQNRLDAEQYHGGIQAYVNSKFNGMF
jgi:hypothetical protein